MTGKSRRNLKYTSAVLSQMASSLRQHIRPDSALSRFTSRKFTLTADPR
jgi:hypothetical protein